MFVVRRLYSRVNDSAKYLKMPKLDPGVRRRREALKTQADDNEEFDFEDLESDFMSVDKTHREHIDNIYALKEKEKFLIVKDKYFKEKYPNFLTWHDKEQIRYLHNSDPEEWNIEKLSEGFPALPEVINKIIRGKWTKRNENKVQNHDKNVLKNWEDFKTGKIADLPEDLKEHLQKFTDRTNNLEPFNYAQFDKKTVNINARVQGEFSEIITSYEILKNKNKGNQQHSSELISFKEKLILEDKSPKSSQTKFKKNIVTLKALQTSIENKAEQGRILSQQEKLIVKPKLDSSGDNNVTEVQTAENVSEIIENKHNTNTNVGFVKKTNRDVSHLLYPEKITIPKNIYRKGQTYKLNDCYYDCDGEFLYRVPGMD